MIRRKEQKGINYIRKFRALVEQEEELYGIPAKIKLAQALLESDAGRVVWLVKTKTILGLSVFLKAARKGIVVII